MALASDVAAEWRHAGTAGPEEGGVTKYRRCWASGAAAKTRSSAPCSRSSLVMLGTFGHPLASQATLNGGRPDTPQMVRLACFNRQSTPHPPNALSDTLREMIRPAVRRTGATVQPLNGIGSELAGHHDPARRGQNATLKQAAHARV